jgi:uncharacterized protein (TIGR02996 family)
MSPPRPELLALLQAAKDQPDDDAPRLVLADWLEENGDDADRARAEFVRLQCAWVRLRHDGPARQELQDQGQLLLNRYASDWLGPLAESTKWWNFKRGLPVARYEPRKHDPSALVGSEVWAWVAELRVWNVKEESTVRRFLESPCLTTVSSLDFSRNYVGPRGAAVLAGSPALAGLRGLDLSDGELGTDGAAALATSPYLAGLRHLALARNDIRREGVAALAGSPHLNALTRLEVTACDIGRDARQRLEERYGKQALEQRRPW